jgi:cell division septum initiation protein DivIVA
MNSSVVQYPVKTDTSITKSTRELMNLIGIQYDRLGINVASLPFAPGDATAGSESEMQTVVLGKRTEVDLPLVIEQSNYLTNIRKRAKSGDTSAKIMTDLDQYLNANSEGIWENSWVRFPRKKLGKYAEEVFQHDVSADKDNPANGKRTDIDRFLYQQNGDDFVRMPVSYLIKISLAEIIGASDLTNSLIVKTGLKVMDNFLNDNTSPETSSFYIISTPSANSIGKNVAKEMAIRYLLGQILIMYANKKFALQENGQEALMFFSPHSPVRQKVLSNCISDSFYRELFMNPCLSGWNHGEEKYEYMHLCHRVLSRSQFNAVLKLREAGIITSNLVSLPNLSNISLANNGTHVSMGSIKLSSLLSDSSSGYTRHHEKYLGDLVVKIVEHFLPLFVGTYTAAPYRLAFTDFHPEKALGFLPHELDYTHLRMLWRRWQKKADLNVLGNPLTPFGPHRLDQLVSSAFHLSGDFVPDFRLIDYLVAILSTEKSPALNGKLHNSQQLKQDLADLGIFDTKMSLYLFDKLREYDNMGFSGFEGRHYSLFDSFMPDMSQAVSLQNLIYLLAFKYIATGRISHENIPDDPFIESERRQIIFGSAIGIPTFFVHKNTGNTFLKRIVEKTQKIRSSSRYSGYNRVYNIEYRRALLNIIRDDATDIIEMLGMRETILDLECRINEPDRFAASGKLTSGILNQANAKSPMNLEAGTFNLAAENYYRTVLRKQHIRESFDILREDIIKLDQAVSGVSHEMRSLLHNIRQGKNPASFMETAQSEVMREKATPQTLEKLVYLILAYIHYKNNFYSKFQESHSLPAYAGQILPTKLYQKGNQV